MRAADASGIGDVLANVFTGGLYGAAKYAAHAAERNRVLPAPRWRRRTWGAPIWGRPVWAPGRRVMFRETRGVDQDAGGAAAAGAAAARASAGWPTAATSR